MLIIITLALTFGLLITASAVLLYKEGMIEINPKTAVVYKNIWTGKPKALLPGIHLIIPGIHKKLLEITLKNEPSDPPITQVFTADPIEIGVDYVIYTQQIVERLDSVIKAATEIDYSKRSELIKDRISAELQKAFGAEKMEDFYNAEAGVDREELKRVEDKVNTALNLNVEEVWGIKVVIRIEDIDFPGKIQEAIEEAVTAPKEGKAIKDKAEAAGVRPEWVVVGEMIHDAIRAFTESKGGE